MMQSCRVLHVVFFGVQFCMTGKVVSGGMWSESFDPSGTFNFGHEELDRHKSPFLILDRLPQTQQLLEL